jgi:protein-disulfide isomerase
MLIPPVDESDHVLAGEQPLVTLVEFGDYECPFCGRAHVVVTDALRRMPREVRFVFRHFASFRTHPHALSAALAAEAAGAQGRFWPMHDTLFENQDALEEDELIGHAEDLGLDINRFVTDLRGASYLPKVRADFRSGARSGVNGTPTFFIDGERFDLGWSDGTLTRALAAHVRERAAGLEQEPYRGDGAVR